MRVRSVALLAGLGMMASSMTVWSLTDPEQRIESRTERRREIKDSRPAANFSDGGVVKLEGRIGHQELSAGKDGDERDCDRQDGDPRARRPWHGDRSEDGGAAVGSTRLGRRRGRGGGRLGRLGGRGIGRRVGWGREHVDRIPVRWLGGRQGYTASPDPTFARGAPVVACTELHRAFALRYRMR